ncbi:hypothetical protein BJ138DRAFT_1007388 [Hygrophoropsis aurantiaca]|uniref:Uncharacterized protein n=1 Tax=Hygrophoropsis aurantiaca TaxID=72124 RepID=A0ACB8AC15_9AGAM|nr:hypothetical protein BJ138DRAFT_1007388 [Hygrophoropsis aurantiaca]
MSQNHVSTKDDLPPPRERKGMTSVQPPLRYTPWRHFVYGIVGVLMLATAWYSYQFILWEREAGGWWNLAIGKRPPQSDQSGQRSQNQGTRWWGTGTQDLKEGKVEGGVERNINGLADALGIPPHELASAVAGAVKEHVPPASLASVASKETGPAVKILLGQEDENEGDKGVMGEFAGGLESMVGLDEPPELDM